MMKILREASALQGYLSANLLKLRPSTTLIVSSAPAPPKGDNIGPQRTDLELKQFHSGVQKEIDKCNFFASMQFNLKTISYGKNTLSGAYPTKINIDEAVELMKRTGAINVVGVGSGPAIDLAKACFYKSREECDPLDHDDAQLILNPSTMGAALAATSRQSLILCPEEEALIPCYSSEMDYAETIVALDGKSISVPEWGVPNDILQRKSQRGDVATIVDCASACLVVALDAAVSLGDVPLGKDAEARYNNIFNECVTSALACIESMETSEMNENSLAAIGSSKKHAITSLLKAGQLLSFGNSASLPRRNIALALSSAILPKYFPRGNWFSFVGSLLPGVCHAIEQSGSTENDWVQKVAGKFIPNEGSVDSMPNLLEWIESRSMPNGSLGSIPSLSSLADGAPDLNELVSMVEDNGAYLNCQDADSAYFKTLIVTSLNR